MNGAPGQQQRHAGPMANIPAMLANMIRPEQVAKLPQLNMAQKQHFHTLVAKFWEVITTTPSNENKHQQAHQSLMATSRQLMNGMKQFRAAQVQASAQARAQAHAQAQAQAQAQVQAQAQAQAIGAGQPAHGQQQPGQQSTGMTVQPQSSAVPFHQLMPEIQRRVNEQHFFFPPAIMEGTKAADDWLREAKARYGQALQRAQLARNKRLELQRTFQQRESSGNPLDAQQRQVYESRVAQCNKAISEGQAFMEKFKEQQAQFQRSQTQQRFANPAVGAIAAAAAAAAANSTATAAEAPAEQVAAPTTTASVPGGAPNAHSITSAVNAARNAAALAAQHPGSPTQGQHPSGTSATIATAPTPNQMSIAQSPAQSQTPVDPSRPSSAHPSQGGVHGAPNAHPLSAVNGIKTQGPTITKILQVTEPKPVQMPPSRPTLNGGAGVGLPGQVAQPALTSLPAYVLETSGDGRVLSKKKLNELVREVFGGATGEDQLTPEAEELFLSVADDFVDSLVQISCRLAKLRGSNSLEPRDIMVVLERQYNIRIPGYSTDEARTARRNGPAPGWAQKMSAVQAAKLTGGGSAGQALGSSGLQAKETA